MVSGAIKSFVWMAVLAIFTGLAAFPALGQNIIADNFNDT